MKSKPTVAVDPTLLLSEKEWNDQFNKRKPEIDKYVLAFFLNDEMTHLKATRKFAKKHSYKLIVVPYKGMTYLQNADIRADAGLEDLLNLIRNAEYVITDSFHITVFSIIYKKQFFTFQRFKEDAFTSQNIRVINLLTMTNLIARMLPYQSTFIKELDEISYENHCTELKNEIQNSKEFLKMAVKNRNETDN